MQAADPVGPHGERMERGHILHDTPVRCERHEFGCDENSGCIGVPDQFNGRPLQYVAVFQYPRGDVPMHQTTVANCSRQQFSVQCAQDVGIDVESHTTDPGSALLVLVVHAYHARTLLIGHERRRGFHLLPRNPYTTEILQSNRHPICRWLKQNGYIQIDLIIVIGGHRV